MGLLKIKLSGLNNSFPCHISGSSLIIYNNVE